MKNASFAIIGLFILALILSPAFAAAVAGAISFIFQVVVGIIMLYMVICLVGMLLLACGAAPDQDTTYKFQ